MSFSYDVKKELCDSINDRDKKFACLYGMLLFCKKFNADEIVFQTENPAVCELFCRLCDDIVGRKSITSVQEVAKKRSKLYVISLQNTADREDIIYLYRVSSRKLVHRIQAENLNNNCLFAFVTGAFLSCGSVAEPIKEYHLEFSMSFEELSNDLFELLHSLNVKAGKVLRKSSYIIYIKESESIEDLLTFMGATMSAIELMNVKIFKDVRNKANRIANCDSANIERTLNASNRQVEEIEYISRKIGLDNIPIDLVEIAELRLEFPEMSLKELGESLDKPLSRSGVNHRLRRISEIYKECIETENL